MTESLDATSWEKIQIVFVWYPLFMQSNGIDIKKCHCVGQIGKWKKRAEIFKFLHIVNLQIFISCLLHFSPWHVLFSTLTRIHTLISSYQRLSNEICILSHMQFSFVCFKLYTTSDLSTYICIFCIHLVELFVSSKAAVHQNEFIVETTTTVTFTSIKSVQQ